MHDGRSIARIGRLAGLLSLVVCATCAADSAPPEYRLHAGDKILVGVYDDPKLPPQEITITPDGKFAFPMLGEVLAGGRTTAQIRAELTTRLKQYVTDPIVTIAVTDVKGNVVYVVGQVNKPGSITMNPTINVLQALSIAGGGNPYAKLDDIVVIRGTASGQQVLAFRYGQVSAGKNLAQNIQLESGDVVVVP
jgi:polysaccharide biosynthesis/export protein